MRAGAVRTDAVARAVEMQDRAAAGRDRVDVQHRRADAHARDLALERPLIVAGIVRHVGRGAAHVEADDVVEAAHRRGAARPDAAAGRAGPDSALALEPARLAETAVRLHEPHARAARYPPHQSDTAAQAG